MSDGDTLGVATDAAAAAASRSSPDGAGRESEKIGKLLIAGVVADDTPVVVGVVTMPGGIAPAETRDKPAL